ncbi:hypothetical protein TNCT_567041 [Trichonephila clavata]|uniref:Uncharacterized protein n=1 Tax=Trichonephila clavata TaxID=2740835 RepID=A0A8X6EZG7_TRICU|nr:hypothetical protein TNCT_567041 [Trichonephila clavata]
MSRQTTYSSPNYPLPPPALIPSPSSSAEDLFQPTVLVNVTPSCLNTPKNPLNAHREHTDREESRPSHLRSEEGEVKKRGSLAGNYLQSF